MNFNKHLDLKGKHAPLGASKYYWLNDDREQLINRICSKYAADIGTIIHKYAALRIEHRLNLSKFEKKDLLLELFRNDIPKSVIDRLDINSVYENLCNYVNDCVGYRMTPEVTLVYSDICFGTCDAISFNNKTNELKIFDLKTGVISASMDQLLIYAALFCIEYHCKPSELFSVELRIYQSNEVNTWFPTVEKINDILERIIYGEKQCQEFLLNQLIFEEEAE